MGVLGETTSFLWHSSQNPIITFLILYNVNLFIERCESIFNKCNKLHDGKMRTRGNAGGHP